MTAFKFRLSRRLYWFGLGLALALKIGLALVGTALPEYAAMARKADTGVMCAVLGFVHVRLQTAGRQSWPAVVGLITFSLVLPVVLTLRSGVSPAAVRAEGLDAVPYAALSGFVSIAILIVVGLLKDRPPRPERAEQPGDDVFPAGGPAPRMRIEPRFD